MTRKEFLKVASVLGIQLSAFPTFSGHLSKAGHCNSSDQVIIIGAGAAGLSAGYLLDQQDIDFRILEATSGYGGRMKKTDNFTDFPIPLGAEWLTVNTSIFDEIVNDQAVSVNVDTIGYNQNDDYGLWENGKLLLSDLGSFNYRKFVGGTWFDFFNEYIVPPISKNIVYDSAVHAVDYAGRKVVVKTEDEEYTADKIIVTVPLKMIQNGAVDFTPPLPKSKLRAISNAVVWDGIKVFLEFSERFYPAYTDFTITPETAGQVSYFDAAYGQATNKKILGLFAVGEPAKNYTSLSNDDLKSYILEELDEIFSNQATPNYIDHIVQNWSEEPYIKGAYLNDHEDWRIVRTLFKPVADKIYFAGEAYTSGDDWGSVHTAVQAARETVDKITNRANN